MLAALGEPGMAPHRIRVDQGHARIGIAMAAGARFVIISGDLKRIIQTLV